MNAGAADGRVAAGALPAPDHHNTTTAKKQEEQANLANRLQLQVLGPLQNWWLPHDGEHVKTLQSDPILRCGQQPQWSVSKPSAAQPGLEKPRTSRYHRCTYVGCCRFRACAAQEPNEAERQDKSPKRPMSYTHDGLQIGVLHEGPVQSLGHLFK